MTLLHLAVADDWNSDADTYGVSTRGQSIADVGFMHASKDLDQLDRVASTFYAGVEEPLVVLVLSEDALVERGFEVRCEPAFPGDPKSELFPHVYGGDIPRGVVTDVYPYDPPENPRA